MSYLSDGPFSYNRFDAMDQAYKKMHEASKPDYLDFDGDGDKKEPMKKALKEKGKKKEVKEGKGEMPDFIKKKMEEKKGKKGCDKCEGEDCKCDEKEEVKEASCGSKGYQKGGKVKGYQYGGKVMKEEESVMNYLQNRGFANNPVSAEVLVTNMSQDWFDAIIEEISEGWMPLPKDKMKRQAGRAYDKEQNSVKAGDEAGVNKQMQRQIAMNNPSGRKAQLGK